LYYDQAHSDTTDERASQTRRDDHKYRKTDEDRHRDRSRATYEHRGGDRKRQIRHENVMILLRSNYFDLFRFKGNF
jgi:hypothetical protein